jgi:hypothetical protein
MNDLDVFTDEALSRIVRNMRVNMDNYLAKPLEVLKRRKSDKVCAPIGSMAATLPLLWRFEAELAQRGFDTHNTELFGPDVSALLNEVIREG